MKSILLASASVLAFAGVAAAEVEYSGEVTMGYNDDSYGDNDGFYWDGNLAVTLSQELDNGLTAGASFDFDFVDANLNDSGVASLGDALDAGGFELFLESDTAGLYFGDTAFAAETLWESAGDMEADGFSEADGETALRGEVMFGNVEAAVSYVIGNADNDYNDDGGLDDLEQLSLGVSADFGAYNVVFAYQEETTAGTFYTAENGDFANEEIFGISFGGSVAGADFRVAYADNSSDDSIGVEVSYPFGPVTATFYYVSESEAAGDNYGLNVAYEDGPISVELDYQDDQGTEKVALEGSYDVGNGLMVYAGYLTESGDDDRYYVGGEFDLGGGASVLVSYAEDDSFTDEDEIGAQEYQNGLTVEAAFEF